MSNTSTKKPYKRPPKPSTLINRAVAQRSTEDLIWALIALSSAELKKDGRLQTLSANHLISLIDQLNKMPEKKEDNSEEVAEIKTWLAAVK
tara:strand:+ start:2815 stop:3087 length:273 start_codon:yes stop_codon:yes gene_type:complete